jgi:hypothetical protein
MEYSFTGEMVIININNVKYPHIKHLYNVEPNIEAFLGRKLFVQQKLDGSNAGFYLPFGR